MPVTKTAKRALRVSGKKMVDNLKRLSGMEVAIRTAKKTPNLANVKKAVSLIDRASKKGFIHDNKAGRLKSSLSKLTIKITKSVTPKNKSAKSAKK